NSAVSWNCAAHVLGVEIAFQHADRQIANYTANADDQTNQDQLCRTKRWKRESKCPRQDHRYRQCPDRSFHRLAGADLASQWVPSEQFSERERTDIGKFSGENDVTNQPVSLRKIRLE